MFRFVQILKVFTFLISINLMPVFLHSLYAQDSVVTDNNVAEGLSPQTSTTENTSGTETQSANRELPDKAPAVELVRASEAEYITFEEGKEGVLIFRGGILLRTGTGTLQAETVKINPHSGEIYGEGNITLNDGNQLVQGDRFIYDNSTGQGVIYRISTRVEPVYYMGDTLKQVSPDTYLVSMAFFTTCDLENPHYHFKARKVWMYTDNQIVALHVLYYVGNTPVFYWPMLFETDIGTGIITQYGHNDLKGHFLQNTYYYGITSDRDSLYIPNNGKLMFDWYQKGGVFFGTRFIKESDFINYDLDIGIADYKQRDIIYDYNDDGSELVTNLVKRADGSYGTVHEFWWKAKADISATFDRSNRYDSQSSLFLRFENYNDKRFNEEFGRRFEPETTLGAIKYGRNFTTGTGVHNLTWQVMYSENWNNNHFSLEMSRQLAWYERSDEEQSKYLPVYDLAPKLRFSKNIQLLDASGSYFAGGWLNLQTGGSINRYYSDGEEVKTLFNGDGMAQFSVFFPLLRWVTLTPSAGYGFFHQFARQADATLEEETSRASYQYIFTRDTLRIGYPELYTQAIYTYRQGFDEKKVDPTFGHQRAHGVNLSVISDLNPVAHFSVTASRDLRRYPYELLEQERWSPLHARAQIDYDFVHGFSGNYYGLRQRRKNHFLGVGMQNDYVYLIRFLRDATNDLNIYYRMGGYKLFMFKELLELKTGFNWHHDYGNLKQSGILFSWEIDILLHDYWRLLMGANSRADRLEIYESSHAAYVPFLEDLGNSLNPFDFNARQNASINLESFHAVVEHYLHRWIMRFSYHAARRSIAFGRQLKDRMTYYEQTFYFSMNLRDFQGFGIPKTELFRYNPTDTGVQNF